MPMKKMITFTPHGDDKRTAQTKNVLPMFVLIKGKQAGP
jgi:hypothetical protein